MISQKPPAIVETKNLQSGTVFSGIIRPFSPHVYTWVQLKGGHLLCWEEELVFIHVDVLNSYPLVEAYRCYPNAVLTLAPHDGDLTDSDE